MKPSSCADIILPSRGSCQEASTLASVDVRSWWSSEGSTGDQGAYTRQGPASHPGPVPFISEGISELVQDPPAFPRGSPLPGPAIEGYPALVLGRDPAGSGSMPLDLALVLDLDPAVPGSLPLALALDPSAAGSRTLVQGLLWPCYSPVMDLSLPLALDLDPSGRFAVDNVCQWIRVRLSMTPCPIGIRIEDQIPSYLLSGDNHFGLDLARDPCVGKRIGMAPPGGGDIAICPGRSGSRSASLFLLFRAWLVVVFAYVKGKGLTRCDLRAVDAPGRVVGCRSASSLFPRPPGASHGLASGGFYA